MITEIARIDIKPGTADDFTAAAKQAMPLFLADPECHGFQLFRGIEQPDQFTLQILWSSVEEHERFRGTPAFAEWRRLVGGYFAALPDVQHAQLAVDGT